MTEEEARAAALAASINYYAFCRPGDTDLPRAIIVETASRFADYILNGE